MIHEFTICMRGCGSRAFDLVQPRRIGLHPRCDSQECDSQETVTARVIGLARSGLVYAQTCDPNSEIRGQQ